MMTLILYHQMLYASSKDALKEKLIGTLEIQVSVTGEGGILVI